MIRFLSGIKKGDSIIAGGKGCNLGEMYGRFNVPNGFVVTTKAYSNFVEIRELEKEMAEQLESLDAGNHEKLEKVSKELKKLILDEKMYEELEKEIRNALGKLSGEMFAVRSSATAEDMLTASFAGQQDTFLNVRKKDVSDAVKKCWASLFNPRAIYYRNEKGIAHDVKMAVVVQEMVNADFAGVMFTIDPIRKKYILIEAVHGLGEKLVSGEVTPSSYMFDRNSLKIAEKTINYEINEKILNEIAAIGLKIEKHFNKPQDIEFAVSQGKIFILQSRAITTL
ncbi:hypothetical protein J4401_04875 [Candidatus Woesearchaeota archaeon]|nr:hypothetical protein [Candidatus Woesearchaeota archaeon]